MSQGRGSSPNIPHGCSPDLAVLELFMQRVSGLLGSATASSTETQSFPIAVISPAHVVIDAPVAKPLVAQVFSTLLPACRASPQGRAAPPLIHRTSMCTRRITRTRVLGRPYPIRMSAHQLLPVVAFPDDSTRLVKRFRWRSVRKILKREHRAVSEIECPGRLGQDLECRRGQNRAHARSVLHTNDARGAQRPPNANMFAASRANIGEHVDIVADRLSQRGGHFECSGRQWVRGRIRRRPFAGGRQSMAGKDHLALRRIRSGAADETDQTLQAPDAS